MESPIGTSAALLLALEDGPAWGLRVIERMRGRSGGTVRLPPGSVYPALRSLEADGLVRGWILDRAGIRGRPRRCYELTMQGIVEAARRRTALEALVGPRAGRITSPAERKEMSERIRRCTRISESGMALREIFSRRARGAS